MMKRSCLLIVVLLLVTGCNLSEATPVPVGQVTRPYVSIAQVATIPAADAERDIRSIPTNTPIPPTPTLTPTDIPYACGINADGEHIQHQVTATIRYAAKTIEVAQRTRYRNEGDVALDEIVYYVEANVSPGAFTLKNVRLNNSEPYRTLDLNRLTVRLPQPLNPGCEVTLDLEFNINVPRIGIGFASFKGYFGYTERQINLAMWLPTPAPRVNQAWLVHNPQSIGEQTVLEQADWDVTLTVADAQDVRIAAPGEIEQLEEQRWRYTLTSARDFSLSLSPNFRVRRQTLPSGTEVEVWHFPDTVRTLDTGTVDGAVHALQVAAESTAQYESLFGAYPYGRLLIVQGDFPDGMEFSGLVFVSTNWFYGFEGGATNYLTLITVHEVSHQWWYARIGNDAAYAPWLDEALATYSEYIYYEEYYPELRDWWWSFRVAWYNPQGAVDSNVYEFANARDYINAVYLRGVQMLHNLREDIGTEAFFELLAAYAAAGDGQIATPDLFWSLFSREQLEATNGTRADFLRNPIDVRAPNNDAP